MQGLNLEKQKFNDEGNSAVQKMDLQEMDYKSRLANQKKKFGFEIQIKGLVSMNNNIDDNLNDRPKIIQFIYQEKDICKIDNINDGFFEFEIGEGNYIEGVIKYTDDYESQEFDTFQISIKEVLQKIKAHNILEYPVFMNKNTQIYLNLKIFQTGVGVKSWLNGYKRKNDQQKKWEKQAQLQKQILEQIDQDENESQITTDQEEHTQNNIDSQIEKDQQKSQAAQKNIQMTQSIIQELQKLQVPDSDEEDKVKDKVQKEFDTYKEDFEKDIEQEPVVQQDIQNQDMQKSQEQQQDNSDQNNENEDNKQQQQSIPQESVGDQSNIDNQQEQNNEDKQSDKQENNSNLNQSQNNNNQSMSQSQSVRENLDQTQDPQELEKSKTSQFQEQQVNNDKEYKVDNYFKNKGLIINLKRIQNMVTKEKKTFSFNISIMDSEDTLVDSQGKEIDIDGEDAIFDELENCVEWDKEIKIHVDCESIREKYFGKLQDVSIFITINNQGEEYAMVTPSLFDEKTGLINVGDLHEKTDFNEDVYYSVQLFDL